MRWFFLLFFLILPALEIGIFIWIGSYIGAGWVVALIILTSLLGIALARQQGLETWKRAQATLSTRRAPGDELMDGVCIFLGALLLIVPGFLTDLLGLFLLTPFTRKLVRSLLKQWLAWLVARKQIFFKRW